MEADDTDDTGDAGVVSSLIRALQDQEAGDRWNAKIFAQIGLNPSVTAADLIQALQDDQEATRHQAAIELRSFKTIACLI
jgi:HEAT repeat protein